MSPRPRHSSRHGTRKSVKKPLAWLSAVVLLVVGAIAVGVASASPQGSGATASGATTAPCERSVSMSLDSGAHLNDGKLIEGNIGPGSFSIVACDLTPAERRGQVAIGSSDTSAITATVATRLLSTSRSKSTFEGTFNLVAVQDADSVDETVWVTIYLGRGTDDEVSIGTMSVTTDDND